MKCKNCGSSLIGNEKFCAKCGKLILKENSQIDIEKTKQKIKRAGNSTYLLGWFNLILNLGMFFWSYLNKNTSDSTYSLSGVFLLIVTSIIYIILGNRIKKNIDSSTKLYLQILIAISIVVSIWLFSIGGRVGFLLLVLIYYLISSLITINKAMKNDKFSSGITNSKNRMGKKSWVILGIISILVFFVTVGIDSSTQNNNVNFNANNAIVSKEDKIKEIVKEIKNSNIIPTKIDEVTELVDITAEGSAIRYHFVLSGENFEKLTNESLRSEIIPKVCKDNDLKKLFDEGIEIEYSYITKVGQKSFFTHFSQGDCLMN